MDPACVRVHSDAKAGGNIAATHASVGGKVIPIKPFDSDNTNPAGGINSNADDMGKWLLTLLSRANSPMDPGCSLTPRTGN